MYAVTFILFFASGETKQLIETFNYRPTEQDINDVGLELVAEHNAANFLASRGYANYKGEWEDEI